MSPSDPKEFLIIYNHQIISLLRRTNEATQLSGYTAIRPVYLTYYN